MMVCVVASLGGSVGTTIGVGEGSGAGVVCAPDLPDVAKLKLRTSAKQHRKRTIIVTRNGAAERQVPSKPGGDERTATRRDGHDRPPT